MYPTLPWYFIYQQKEVKSWLYWNRKLFT